MRLSTVIGRLISPAQACAVPERSIQQHLSALRDIVYWCANRGSPSFIMSVDQEKAFDRVCHEFMFYVLRRAGFGDRFLRFVQVLYAAKARSSSTGIRRHLFPCSQG